MSFKADRARFKLRSAGWAAWSRYKGPGNLHQPAWKCGRAGDEDGFAQYMAKADAAPTLSLSAGPPVPRARRQPPPESPE